MTNKWLCFLQDRKTDARVVVGVFDGRSDGEAIEAAKRSIRGTMKNLVGNWYMAAEPVPA